jgi:hypothetical protein
LSSPISGITAKLCRASQSDRDPAPPFANICKRGWTGPPFEGGCGARGSALGLHNRPAQAPRRPGKRPALVRQAPRICWAGTRQGLADPWAPGPAGRACNGFPAEPCVEQMFMLCSNPRLFLIVRLPVRLGPYRGAPSARADRRNRSVARY